MIRQRCGSACLACPAWATWLAVNIPYPTFIPVAPPLFIIFLKEVENMFFFLILFFLIGLFLVDDAIVANAAIQCTLC